MQHSGDEIVVAEPLKRPDFGRKGSVIAQKYATGVWVRKAKVRVSEDGVLTNEEVVRAVHGKVQVCRVWIC